MKMDSFSLLEHFYFWMQSFSAPNQCSFAQLSKHYTHTVITQTTAEQAMYSTCTITHAIITKQYAMQFYGQYNRYYYQKEKEGKIQPLNGSLKGKVLKRWFSQCNRLLPPRSTGISHYPVFLHLILPLLTIYQCPSACAGSQACQILWWVNPTLHQKEPFIPFFLLYNVENAHTRVHQGQEQTKECMVRSNKVKQNLPLSFLLSSQLYSLSCLRQF